MDRQPQSHRLSTRRECEARDGYRESHSKGLVFQEPTACNRGEDYQAMIRVLSLIAMLLCSLPAWVQAQEERIPWSQLSPTDQQYLQRFSEKWDHMPRQRQERLLNGANRWRNMTPEERQEAKQRFQRWRELPPEQQQHLRERFQRFRELPPEQQESLREARRWFKSLPPEQRQELKGKWKNMTPEERQAFRKDFHRPAIEQDRSEPSAHQ